VGVTPPSAGSSTLLTAVRSAAEPAGERLPPPGTVIDKRCGGAMRRQRDGRCHCGAPEVAEDPFADVAIPHQREAQDHGLDPASVGELAVEVRCTGGGAGLGVVAHTRRAAVKAYGRCVIVFPSGCVGQLTQGLSRDWKPERTLLGVGSTPWLGGPSIPTAACKPCTPSTRPQTSLPGIVPPVGSLHRTSE
jgi:hypothetical protein